MKRKSRKYLSLLLAAVLIVGMMPMEWGTELVKAEGGFTGGTAAESGQWKDWTWSVFGNSTNTDNNVVTQNDDGSVTLKTTGNKGKIASKNEGINYLSYELSKSQDFILKTTATTNTWAKTNQSGFGLMARAAVGTHGETAEADPMYSAFVGGSVQTNVYLGSYRNASGRSNIGDVKNDVIAAGKSYDLCMQKVGDVLNMWFDGELVATESASDFITGEQMYVGLFTSRNCDVTYSDTSLTVREDGAVEVIHQTNPSKTAYIAGNTYKDIDLTGFCVDLTVGGVSKTVTARDCAVKSFDFDTETESGVLILDYFGTELAIPVTVMVEKVTDITVNYLPVKTEYAVGDTQIDWRGFDAVITYNSGVTKKLEDLITEEDPEVEVSYDFSASGSSGIVIKYTHGNVTKQVSIPVEVTDAAVTSLTIAGPDQDLFYKNVAVDADAYEKGLLVTAHYNDGTQKILSHGFTVAPKAEALDVTKTGNYTYVVSFGGKTAEYTLKVVERTVKELVISAYPDVTTFEKGTEFSSEGIEISAVYDSGEKVVLTNAQYVIDSSAYQKDAAGDYAVKISATVDGKSLETGYTAAVREKVEYSYEGFEWNKIVFGQSIDKEGQPIVTDEADGTKTITVEQAEGKGKCTTDGHDGIAYYYTTLNPGTDNFEMTAKVTVDYFITKAAPDNGEGFGIMLRDSIGEDQDSSIYYGNAMTVGGNQGRYNVFGRYGIKSQDDIAGKVNCNMYEKIGNLSEQIKEDAPKVFYLTLKKDNTGIYATMKNEAGDIVDGIDNVMYYMPSDAYASRDTEKMYLGFMAARGAKMEVNTADIQIRITSSASDAPQRFEAEKPLVPSVSYDALLETGDEAYEINTIVNTKGLLTIKQDGETIISQDAVEAGKHSYQTALTVGANKFQVYFEPDATQNITSAQPLIVNRTVTRKIYAASAVPIYVTVDGTADGDGTRENPLDVMTALTYCQAGQQIIAAGGTYQFTKEESLNKGNDGTDAQHMKQLIADPESTEKVVFDFAIDGKPSENTMYLSGNYWYFKGITFANGYGVRLGGDYNVLEACDFTGNTNSGLSICRTDDSNDIADWPSYNQIINCNAYSNRDASDNNADGFAAKLTCGVGNILKGCVAAYNADDGWDLFAKGATGPIGAVKVYNCVSFANGYAYDAETGSVTKTKGDGNGFKMGGSGIAVAHEIYNSVSFGNGANGFTNNSDPMGTFVDCTGYNNGGANLELHTYAGVDPQFVVTNFKSYADDSYKQITDLAATESESNANCIDPLRSANNFFYNSKTGKSENSLGNELTNENFASLAQFASYINGGIESIQRDAEGNIDLGTFLLYRDVSVINAEIQNAKDIIADQSKSAKYTEESIAVLKAATEHAAAVLGTDADQKTIDQEAEVLQAAVKQLVVKPVEKPTEGPTQKPAQGTTEVPAQKQETTIAVTESTAAANADTTELSNSEGVNSTDGTTDALNESQGNNVGVQAGDHTNAWIYVSSILFAAMLMGIAVIGSRKKKRI